MKKRLTITVILLLFIIISLAIIHFQLSKKNVVKGRIIKITDTNFKMKTDEGTEFAIPLSFIDDNCKISKGDLAIIYYQGDILETSPARIKKIKKVEIK